MDVQEYYNISSEMEANTATHSTADQEAREINSIVVNMLEKCKYEANHNMLQIPLEDFEERVLYYSGITKTKLDLIQGKNTSASYPKTYLIDFNTHLIILKCLTKFYERKEFPSFRLLFKHVNELILTVQDAEQFKADVTLLGINYQTIFNDTKLLMEDPKITFERYLYLKKMKKIRRDKKAVIYYIGERIIDKDSNFYNPWKQNTQASDICSGKCIFLHAISRIGFTNGLFCFSATEDDFYKWLVNILLPSLSPSSVVVLDNSPLHGTSKSQSLSMFDTKYDMRKWLRKHNVPCSDAMNKSQLYQLVKNHVVIEEMPRVDRVIKANGHEVLRLPTHFEDLSPIENIWQYIKSTVLSQNDLHDEILSMLVNMSKITYELYETDIENKENEILAVDSQMDNILENYLLSLK